MSNPTHATVRRTLLLPLKLADGACLGLADAHLAPARPRSRPRWPSPACAPLVAPVMAIAAPTQAPAA
jgi:hypothetical protein